MELLSLLSILLLAPLVYLVLLAVVTKGLQFALPSDLQLPPPTPILIPPKQAKTSGAEDEGDTKGECSPLILPEGAGCRKTEDRTIAVCSPLADLRQRPFVGMRGLDRQNSDVNRRLSEVRHSE